MEPRNNPGAAEVAVRLQSTTEAMANKASVDMVLWDAHSNACLEAISMIERQIDEIARLKVEKETAPDPVAADGIVDGLRRLNPWVDMRWPEKCREAADLIERLEAERDRDLLWQNEVVLPMLKRAYPDGPSDDVRSVINRLEQMRQDGAERHPADIARARAGCCRAAISEPTTVGAADEQIAEARAEGRRAGLEEAAKLVESRGPATQDMTSTAICEALDEAAAAIRSFAEKNNG